MTEEAGTEAPVPAEDHDLTISPETMVSETMKTHSPKAEESTAGDPLCATDPIARSSLKFAENAGKPSYRGYLPLDVVLNHVGQTEFPEKWGLTPGWEHMPFLWRRKKKAYCHVIFKPSKVHKRKRRFYSKLAILDVDYKSLTRCSRLYRKICREMKRVFRRGELEVHAIDPVLGRQVPIRDSDIFAAKRIDVFYTGTARVHLRGEELTRCRLAIKEKDYESWLLKRQAISLMRAIANIIDDNSYKHKYRVTTTKFDEDILPLFSREGLASVRAFTDQIFGMMKYKAGAGVPQYDLYRKHISTLIDDINAELDRHIIRSAASPVPRAC